MFSEVHIGRVDVALHGGVLGRQTKGVEPDGEQDVVALHPHQAGPRIGWGHGVPVPHVEVARRVGEHGEGVVLGAVPIDAGPIEAVGLPALLPGALEI